MHGPATAGWLLVTLCAASGAYCLLRMRRGAGEERRAAGGEALMGFGMAAMAVPAAVFVPPSWSWAVYAAVFGGAALRALWSARRGGHHLHHTVGSVAMVYMALAMTLPAQGAHGAHGAGAAGLPVLTGALLLYYTVYVLRSGARLVPAGVTAGGASPGWAARPELAAACRLSMGLAMLAMLVTM
ncbi:MULTISPECIES: DUF5134 domain-containing protein [Streptomyces]|uniref:DUF5134 domain-containing protein n=1 Tax=Streptomyces solicathayae TaxID=3081768 RepID=A0ABZ0M2L1_9ACTN|nr:DUF5134 domain-containing protein [Streptomyces sp. HUAS YS2]WOX25908.1 DUF5134 domain-containing protein [Streptomyces sp. HUAS YS2]